jgi:hypothetical protein
MTNNISHMGGKSIKKYFFSYQSLYIFHKLGRYHVQDGLNFLEIRFYPFITNKKFLWISFSDEEGTLG